MAQTAWDAPPLISHVAPAGVSLFLVSPAGGDLGGLVTFRHEAGPVGMGYRLSLTDENASDDDSDDDDSEDDDSDDDDAIPEGNFVTAPFIKAFFHT
ncbi:MAG: hypothetical protein ACPHO4_14855, partial [Longimicrobiales bacterium]